MANRLFRLDERAAYVMVADEPESKLQARFRRVADSRGDSGVGNRHNDVSVCRALARELLTHLVTALVNRAAEHDRVRSREVNVFEDAVSRLELRQRERRMKPVLIDDQNFAGLHVAQVSGVDQIERAGL